MTSSRSTKRALLTSALAILMCVAMLIGSTFAWFTDTASTAVNKIQAGNLDIEVQYRTTADGEWKTLDNATDLFGAEGTLFEPGHTRVVELRITNAGNLALKYKIGMNVVSETAGINKAGNSYKLSEYLKVATTGIQQYNPTDQISSLMERLIFQKGDFGMWTARDFANFELEYTSNGSVHELQPGAAQILGIKVYMPTTVGNEANAISPEKVASISFGLNVVATQYTTESDSYGTQYDKDATYPVMNSTGLSNALNEAEEGSTVVVASGEYELPSTGIPAGVSVSGAGMGKTNLTAPATKSGNQKTGLVVDKPGVTVSNATITGHADITSDMYCGLLDIRKDGTVLDGVEIVNRTSLASGVVIKSGVGVGETVTMKNSKLNVYYRAFYIVDGANGTIEIDNCDITGSVYALNVNSANSQDLVIKCTNSKLHGWSSYGDIKSASFENVEFSKGASEYDYLRPYADTTLKNCTFDSSFKMGAGKAGFTITIEDCTYNGTVLTADNVRDLMFDSDDLENLKGCTITVNGENVVL